MFKKQLKFFLQERSTTAAELSRRTGVPKQTISDWLAGTHPRNMEYVRKVAEHLDVAIAELYFGQESKTRARKDGEIFAEAIEMSLREHRIDTAFNNFLFKNALTGLYRIIDLKTGFPSQVSSTWEQVIGWNPHEIKKRHWLEMVHPEDRPRMSAVVEQNLRMKTPVSVCEYRALHKNGGAVRLHGRFAVDPDHRALLCNSVRADHFSFRAGGSETSDSKKSF